MLIEIKALYPATQTIDVPIKRATEIALIEVYGKKITVTLKNEETYTFPIAVDDTPTKAFWEVGRSLRKKTEEKEVKPKKKPKSKPKSKPKAKDEALDKEIEALLNEVEQGEIDEDGSTDRC